MNDTKLKYAAYVGLDWAEKKHDVCVQIGNDEKRTYNVIEHNPEAIEQWLVDLHNQVKGNIAVVLELNKDPIVYALQNYSFVTVYPIHGLTLARHRKAIFPSGAKDDPTDAELALDMMLHYPKKITPLKPSSDATRKLNHLVAQRRLLVEDKRRNVNRLINALKQYDPQPLDWFSHRDNQLFFEFLLKWSNLQSLKRARHTTIANFFKSYGGNAVSKTAKRIEAIDIALPLTQDDAVIM